MRRTPASRFAVVVFVACLAAVLPACAGRDTIDSTEPIVYTLRFPDPASQTAEVEVNVPADGRDAVELMMAVWTPGFYRVENYAEQIQGFSARTPDGEQLTATQPRPNRWRIDTGGAANVVFSYRLQCSGRSVTRNWVGPEYAVLNGPATFVTLVEDRKRPHEVHVELPDVWPQSMTSLDAAPDGLPNHYVAPDYDILADSPIVAGMLDIHEFDVAGTRHLLVNFGDIGEWDGGLAARQIQQIADEHRRFLGFLPFEKYVFLNAFRRGGGGLEHLNSTLLTSSSARSATPTISWLEFVSHEYFHAINVKRLRPVELGPFDYENPPQTATLWIAEGLTSYYGDLAVVRSGVGTVEDFLDGNSSRIRQLQSSPGRLLQTLEESSLEVWTNSTSGVGVDPEATVSYYGKGAVLGLLLDARIRRLTDGARSLDDVVRLAYERYSGERGFTPEEFRATASEVAGSDLSAWFVSAVNSTEELDYSEMLEWFGLRFATADEDDPSTEWVLEIDPDAGEQQLQRFRDLVSPSSSGSREPADELSAAH